MNIVLVNLKGGVGKTTSAVALATAAERSGKKVLVMDADPQGSTTDWILNAREFGDPLPFDVVSANVSTVKRMKKGTEDWNFIDCPPNGQVTDEAIAIADFVIVPTTPDPLDRAKTWDTVRVLEENGIFYAILLLDAKKNTILYRKAVGEIEDNKASRFETVIWGRQAIKDTFCRSFGDDLFGYEAVFAEIEEALR